MIVAICVYRQPGCVDVPAHVEVDELVEYASHSDPAVVVPTDAEAAEDAGSDMLTVWPDRSVLPDKPEIAVNPPPVNVVNGMPLVVAVPCGAYSTATP